MRVTITGSSGRIGRRLMQALAGSHELRPVDRALRPGHTGVAADLSVGFRTGRGWWRRWSLRSTPRWERAFEGAEVVIHLASTANPQASWPAVLRNNVQTTWNVLEAAARHGARRVVLASSCRWVLGLEAIVPSEWPALGITSASPPRPRSAYGLSKAFTEQAGRLFVDDGRLASVVAVRIGHYREEEPPEEAEHRLWVRPADLEALMRRCLETQFTGFHVVYGLSRQACDWADLSHTRDLLAWSPEGAAGSG